MLYISYGIVLQSLFAHTGPKYIVRLDAMKECANISVVSR